MNDKKIEKRFENVGKSKTFQNILKAYSLNKKSVLDIGSSYGEFLAHFGKGSVGLTISKEESDYGKERGLDNRYGNIEDENVPVNQKFDAIFANNIFEHLYSPHSFLIKVKKFLKDDGVLILGVPAVPKIVFLWKFSKFRGSLAHSHINFFTRQTLQKTVERGGWFVLENRSFHSKNSILDWLLNLIAPHFYVVARPDMNFSYHEKRQNELKGYKSI
jgi:SAM-dependent methyltransferase